MGAFSHRLVELSVHFVSRRIYSVWFALLLPANTSEADSR